MGMHYNESMTDKEILDMIHQGDQQAMDFLIGRYKNYVRKKAKAFYLIGGDQEDLIQEGMIGLYKAIRTYQSEREAAFFTFADLCISRQMYTAIKNSNTKKNQPLNNYVSFDLPGNFDNPEGISYIDLLTPNYSLSPEELLIGKENAKHLEDLLSKRLTGMERKILLLYLQDYNYSEIAKVLKREPKSVDNALQRIKRKLNLILSES